MWGHAQKTEGPETSAGRKGACAQKKMRLRSETRQARYSECRPFEEDKRGPYVRNLALI